MDKKKTFKISKFNLLLILGLIIIGVIIAFMYKFHIDSSNSISLELGNYTVNEVKLDESGVSNEECGVTLKENNEFQIYMGWGSWHSGKYDIKNNTLICESTLLEWESGGYVSRSTNVVFIFKIIDENKLELSNVDIKDTNNEKLVYEEGLTVGMTYSMK